MISSNGGTWSTWQSSHNNIVKSFKFQKGDVIVCEYDPFENFVRFLNEKSNEKYELEIKQIAEDPLHPCVLFYYLNDEIEFVNNYKGN